jgi:riboflavin kinase/FMN adenylyltransferase
MSIGTHPTVLQLEKAIIEIHIIDFNQTIYGKYIFFEFVDFMRDNIKFDNTDDLIAQLKKDRLKAKKALQ